MIQIAELLFAMSLSGTFAFLIYFAESRLLSSRFSAGMRYFCLKVCMLFFLIPFPAVKHLLLSSAKPYVSNFVRETPILYDKNAIIQTTTGFRFPFLTFPVKLFLLIWGALLFAFFVITSGVFAASAVSLVMTPSKMDIRYLPTGKII